MKSIVIAQWYINNTGTYIGSWYEQNFSVYVNEFTTVLGGWMSGYSILII